MENCLKNFFWLWLKEKAKGSMHLNWQKKVKNKTLEVVIVV